MRIWNRRRRLLSRDTFSIWAALFLHEETAGSQRRRRVFCKRINSFLSVVVVVLMVLSVEQHFGIQQSERKPPTAAAERLECG